MGSAKDFIIENGILKNYIGPGGDVIIPEGGFNSVAVGMLIQNNRSLIDNK